MHIIIVLICIWYKFKSHHSQVYVKAKISRIKSLSYYIATLGLFTETETITFSKEYEEPIYCKKVFKVGSSAKGEPPLPY